MRLAGRIVDWNDDKGFGFVVPSGGGDRAFVHVNDFQRGSRRAVEGDLISYLPSRDRRGRLKASQVRHAGQRIEVPRVPSRIPRVTIGVGALLAIALLALVGPVPMALALAYYAMSLVSFLMYAADKASAGRGGQRTPENTLHLADLLGGWPGALIAQQRFRHKTIKQPFQLVFWATVVLNLIAAAWLVRTGLAAELGLSILG